MTAKSLVVASLVLTEPLHFDLAGLGRRLSKRRGAQIGKKDHDGER